MTDRVEPNLLCETVSDGHQSGALAGRNSHWWLSRQNLLWEKHSLMIVIVEHSLEKNKTKKQKNNTKRWLLRWNIRWEKTLIDDSRGRIFTGRNINWRLSCWNIRWEEIWPMIVTVEHSLGKTPSYTCHGGTFFVRNNNQWLSRWNILREKHWPMIVMVEQSMGEPPINDCGGGAFVGGENANQWLSSWNIRWEKH